MNHADTAELQPTSSPERDTVLDLSQLVLHDVAPQELAIFDEVTDEYFDDPAAVLEARAGDQPVAFGLDIALLTPYVLAVVTAVVKFIGGLVSDAVKDEATPVVAQLVRRLFRGGDDADGATPAPLDAEQAARVREVALDRATAIGLDENKARFLAEAVADRLRVSV